MKKVNSKQKLFEVMEKINPDFKILNEDAPIGTQPVMGDIKSMQNTTTTSQQTALSRIDTPNEFSQAFKVWFSSLGFDPNSKPIAIGRITTEITNILKSLGYR